MVMRATVPAPPTGLARKSRPTAASASTMLSTRTGTPAVECAGRSVSRGAGASGPGRRRAGVPLLRGSGLLASGPGSAVLYVAISASSAGGA